MGGWSFVWCVMVGICIARAHTHTHTQHTHIHTYTHTYTLTHTHTHTRTGLGQELFPRAVVTLRQMVQELLCTLDAPLHPPSPHTKTQPNSTTPQRFGRGGWGAGTRMGLEVEVGMCAVELGRVVCHWMRSLSTVRCALSMAPPPGAAVWCRVAGGASDDDDQALNIEAPLSTVLAHLVYVSVLWSPGGYVTASPSTALPPPAAGEGEDGEGVDAGLVADDLHAALLSGPVYVYIPEFVYTQTCAWIVTRKTLEDAETQVQQNHFELFDSFEKCVSAWTSTVFVAPAALQRR